MYNILLRSHSGLRWVFLIAIVFAIVSAINRWVNNKEFNKTGKVFNITTLATAHLQLLTGLLLYFISPKVRIEGMLKDDIIRFFTLEHLSMMILAITLITLGHMQVKKAQVKLKKNRGTVLYFGLALIIVLAAIPWPFMEKIGGSWF